MLTQYLFQKSARLWFGLPFLLLIAFPVKVSAQDPAAHWQMDESGWTGTSGEVIDSSGNGNNGTARTAGGSNSLPDTEDAKVCRGGRFRGQGFVEDGVYTDAQHYVDVPDAPELSPQLGDRDMTISGWVKLNSTSGTQTLVHKGEGGASQEYNVTVDNGTLQLTLWNRYGGGETVSLDSEPMAANRWYFFEAQVRPIYSVSGSARVALRDANGNLLDEEDEAMYYLFDDDYHTAKPLDGRLVLGGVRYGSGSPVNFLDGTLDEVRIHDDWLDEDELRDLALDTRDCDSPEPLICMNDEFSTGSLSEDWATSVSRGSFTPQVVNGRLRMTQNVGDQATAASYQGLFPGADNLIQVEFDYYAYGGSGADGLAVVFSDAAVTPQAGGYGGSLGYAQEPDGSGGFAGGWLGVGLDEYGNFSHDSEGRVGGNNDRTQDSVALRGAAPDYAYIADSGELSPGIDSNNDSNPYRYRITIDSRGGQVPVITVERNGRGTGNRFQTVVQETLSSQPDIPENLLLSLTASTGGSTNIHELDNLQICAEKTGEVQARVDHFEIEHSGTALTCRPEEIVIRACKNDDCSETFPDPVEVTLAPSGWLGGDTFTITDGVATRSLAITTPGTVTLGVPESDPGTVAFSQTLCDDGSGVLAADQCDLIFVDSGFDISIPDHIADTEVPARIAAVRKDDTSEKCVPGFDNETKPVALWSTYVNPSSGTRSLFLEGNPMPSSAGATTSLSFDGDGVATVDIRYPDVGRVRLNARYDGSGEDAGLIMVGDGAFVARPDHFELDIPGNPGATAVQDDNVFVAAGEEFEVGVSAINASGNVTPNFGRETPAESVSVDASLVAPSGGSAPPLTGAFGPFGEDCSGASAPGGTACGWFEWPEVGIIRMTPTLSSASYLGSDDVTGNAISHVGRFIPARFGVTVAEHGEVESYCAVSTAFAYTGQALSWRAGTEPLLILEALNANGGLTQNYTIGSFQRLSIGGVSRTPGDTDLSAVDALGDLFPVTANLDTPTLPVVGPGRLEYRFSSSDEITYDKTPQTRVAPFTPDYRIELTRLEDADNVSSPQLPIAIEPDFDFEMRYGRLQLENVYGPETSDLVMPFRVDYYTEEGFVQNTADSCWAYSTDDVVLDQSGLSGGSTSVIAASDTLVAGAPATGSEIVLTAPGEGNRGDVRVTFPVPIWLTGDYDDDGVLEDPSGLATFGVYRGSDRIIYWREVEN
ncbi:DUF6701 domain-containing protein [Marinobacter sp. M1N3S26]|uniref:DUF6701 domain-containing protein n=1 Tax=Marinobacter sp. M1N3S26 TaxID=3382299 RepID=UPI00387AF7A2